MLHWATVEERASRLVRGVTSGDGKVDSHKLDEISKSYDRSVFFCPPLKSIRGMAAAINSYAHLVRRLPSDEIPGRNALTIAANFSEPISLESIFRIEQCLKVLHKDNSVPERLRQFLNSIFINNELLLSNTIIPSLYAYDPQELRSLRETAAPNVDSMRFSGILLGDTEIIAPARRYLYGRLESGYASTAGRSPGLYKLTERTAKLLHTRLLNTSTLADCVPPFDYLFSIDASAGPRNGQVSRGLPVPFGNLVD